MSALTNSSPSSSSITGSNSTSSNSSSLEFTFDYMSDLMMHTSDLERQLFDTTAPNESMVPAESESSATVVSTGSSEELQSVITTSSGGISKSKRKKAASASLDRRYPLSSAVPNDSHV